MEVTLEKSHIFVLTNLGNDLFEVKEDGSIEIISKATHLKELKGVYKNVTAAKKTAKDHSVERDGSLDEILDAIATKLEDDDRREQAQ